MRNLWLTLATVFFMAASPLLFGQRGGGGRGGPGRPGGGQPTMGASHGPRQEPGQKRLRARATDKQREHYRLAKAATSRVRTRAREMQRLARAAEVDLAGYRSLLTSLQSEIRLMQQEQGALISQLSEEQRAATGDAANEIEADLKELDVWAEAMDEELQAAAPGRAQLGQQAWAIEKKAEEVEEDYRELDAALDLE